MAFQQTVDYARLDSPNQPRLRNVKWHAFLHALSILLAACTVVAFPCRSLAPWSLPTTNDLKTTQQQVNFIIIGFALLMSMLLSYCLTLTNDAEAQAEFLRNSLSLPGLDARMRVSRRSVMRLFRQSVRNSRMWSIAAPYAVAMLAFSANSWVQSIIFILDVMTATHGSLSTTKITLSKDVPSLPDPCRDSLTTAGCTYDLATSALTSQLITHTPFTFANITFSGPEGTRGLSIGAMQEFADMAAHSKFGSEMSEYCLPALKPNLVFCSLVEDDSRAKVIYMSTTHDDFLNVDLDTYEIIINPDSPYNQTYVVTSSHFGVMTVSRSQKPEDLSLNVLVGTGQYADLLSQLSTSNPTPYTRATYNQTQTTVLCEVPYQSSIYSWNWVKFALNGGVMTASVSNTTCADNSGPIPFEQLDYAIQGATTLNTISDGYSKLLNTDYLAATGPAHEYMSAYNMSPLEYILSQAMGSIHTAWSATNAEIADKTPIDRLYFEHRYTIRLEIEGVTIIALCVSCLILACTIWQAWRWVMAIAALKKFVRGDQTGLFDSSWQILEPFHLLLYGGYAKSELNKLNLTSEAGRMAAMKDNYGLKVGSGPGTLVPNGLRTAYESFGSSEDLMHDGPRRPFEHGEIYLQPMKGNNVQERTRTLSCQSSSSQPGAD